MVTFSNWQKSTYSGGHDANCVEVGRSRTAVALRESDEPGTVLVVSEGRLASLLRAVKEGRLDGLAG